MQVVTNKCIVASCIEDVFKIFRYQNKEAQPPSHLLCSFARIVLSLYCNDLTPLLVNKKSFYFPRHWSILQEKEYTIGTNNISVQKRSTIFIMIIWPFQPRITNIKYFNEKVLDFICWDADINIKNESSISESIKYPRKSIT